ncbi:SDR family NAD(P)-dependent oxidoreductase [Nocardia sputorum]|uniref:Short-chain dehydrogenase/reductase n=1 Tax=Nocardia sputorum TaxID=2984338 RepID=A0ABM8CWE0_9NOCA|nr:SDR family NAD(P)-dependent oxidoreductase [Nocardia sputorum]BDT99306.1 putative short-chain dehydrogenase/reductase [Nocardia sputorum]
MRKFPPIPLSGAIVVITGGARGIGLATAGLFASKGARVVIGDLTADAAASAAQTLGSKAFGYPVDVGDKASYQRLIDAVEREVGPIDVLVNNAGIMPVGGLLDEDDAVAVATFNVNYWAHYHALKIIAPRMMARGRGHIVNVTSAAGKLHSPGLGSYVAAKHAATGLSRCAREELMASGISVTAVLPWAVRTQLVDGIPFNAWERMGIVSPTRIARTIVGTLGRRPALVGGPPGLLTALNLAAHVPEPLWLLGRRWTNADRVMGPIDRDSRKEYDDRITMQTATALTSATAPVIAPGTSEDSHDRHRPDQR